VHPTLLAFKELLVTSTARTVEVVSLPVNLMANDVVYVWPWRVEEVIRIQRIPSDPQDIPMLPILKINCLVFTVDIEVLELIRAAVFQNSVLVSASSKVIIQSDPIDTAVLLNVFLAANVQLRPCLNYLLQTNAV
jgi:hypothetical protein